MGKRRYRLITREVRVGNQAVCIAGVGNVASHLAFQRKGLAGQLMQSADIYMREKMRVAYA